MPSSRKKILGHVISGLCEKMGRTKHFTGDIMETPLKRCLNTFDITLLGVGHMVGAGIYVLTGSVARNTAGPGIVVSFIFAGIVSLLAALCYAEFGTKVPKAGSAYVYTYVSVGEFWAFVVGWNIILEHMIGAASVARAWSGYVDSLFGGVIANTTISITGCLHEQLLGKYPDFLALFVCLAYTLLLGIGVKGSAIFNSIFTIINLTVMGLVIVVGFYYADLKNVSEVHGGVFPYGFGGVLAGAATCFYAFVGFDSIATSSEEATNPSYSVPIATVLSMAIVTVGYVLVGAALTLMIPYTEIKAEAALPEAFSSIHVEWARYVVSIGALCGMTTTLFGSLFSLPRCMYSMASDGLLFSCFAKVNKKTQLPILNLAVAGVCSAIIALLFDLDKLVEFMSIGTLLAYTIVSASVIILRYKPPTVEEAMTLGLTAPDTPGTDVDDSSMSGTELGTPSSEIMEVALAGRLKAQYLLLETPLNWCGGPGTTVPRAVSLYTVVCAALCFLVQCKWKDISHGAWWPTLTIVLLILTGFACILLISAHRQNVRGLNFVVPLVPWTPAISILFNIELMVHLNPLTWVRLLVWMALGMLVYFLYGIHHSKEGETSYSILMTSSEAGKNKWGATTALKHALIGKKNPAPDQKPIIDEDE